MSYVSVQGTLPAATPTVVFTGTVGKTAIVQSIRASNSIAYNFSVVRFNDNLSDSVQIYTVALSAGDILTDTNPMVLKGNDYIELTSSAAGTNYMLYIIEY
jgi:hypothetical protein